MPIVTHRVGKNKISQLCKESDVHHLDVAEVVQSWENVLSFKKGGQKEKGLRSAQLGALFAIKSHWTISNETATIVMPTGTGKTETMIAAIVSETICRTLVIVPSKLLRDQTSDKFQKFGVLKDINVIDKNALFPSVATLESTPTQLSELKEIISNSNIIVTTMSLLQRFSDSYLDILALECDALIVDEAHHIAANQWAKVKSKLKCKKCIQFTATPFRNDNKKIDGKIIYNFPLSMAQEQGYFQRINFLPIYEFDEAKGDKSIADAAILQLENDLKEKYNHIVLVRAKNTLSASRLYDNIYNKYYSKYNPVLIHSRKTAKENNDSMALLKSGESKIVVCVDMFGEGIDIPNLKIAAVHDKYKSLPITLQFIGRFARSSDGLGTATVVTNIANDELSESLNELYAQDSDWNKLLHEMSKDKIDTEISLQQLVDGFDMSTFSGLSIQQLRPKISMVAYNINESSWNIDAISDLFDQDKFFMTINNDRKVAVVIEKTDSNVAWTPFRGINDTNWNLHLIYWNTANKICFINSTDKGFTDKLAETIFSSPKKIEGEIVFRCLHGINRLMLASVGLKSAIDGPIRYRMFAGIDIADGINESQKSTSYKSNLFGRGYNGHGVSSIGCSYKGIIWSRWVESIDYWMEWCTDVGTLLQNNSIDTSKIFEGALVPKIISQRPNSLPYLIEWPLDLDIITDSNLFVMHNEEIYSLDSMHIRLVEPKNDGAIQFAIGNEYKEVLEKYELNITADQFKFSPIKYAGLKIRHRGKEMSFAEFFNQYPPRIKFVDQSTLEGNYLVEINTSKLPIFKDDKLIAFDWSNVDIHKESQGISRDKQSIQYAVIQHLIDSGEYSIIFDDDGAGEVADIVCFKEHDNIINIKLYHCKYAHGDKPGARVADLYEVCGQAEKSIKWCQNPPAIVERLLAREYSRVEKGGTRLDLGTAQKLREIKNKMKKFPVKIDIAIVQPGIASTSITDDMRYLLSGTASYLMDTYSIDLKVICS